ncbi:hypothetical protein D3C81_2035280 [compost metagenome]
MPMMKPNMLKVTAVRTRKMIINSGCAISNETKRRAVASISTPRMMDLVAAAPT